MFQENASANCLNIETTSTEDGAFPKKGHSARVLSPEEAEKLAKDQVLVSEFKQLKLEKEAQKNWDLFYKRNSTNFFKDRHWTTREFQELKACREFADQKLTILEAGCGVGNCLFPLLEEDLNIFAYACDFSPRAVEYVKKNALYCTERCKVFQCDLTKDDLLDNIPADSLDVVTLIFVLSAIHPDKMHLVLRNIYKGTANMPMEVLCGSAVKLWFIQFTMLFGKKQLFRLPELCGAFSCLQACCMCHHSPRAAVSEFAEFHSYLLPKGKRPVFSKRTDHLHEAKFLSQLFKAEGYEQVVSEYVQRETVNRKEDLRVPRVFLQSKFQKPFSET